MTPIERNPDIQLDKEEMPTGLQFIAGKNLMHTARSKNIPFGVATRVVGVGGIQRRATVGLIIRDEDAKRFRAAIAAKNNRLSKLDK